MSRHRACLSWITYAAWTCTGAQPISSFSTTWVVPPAPAASGAIKPSFAGVNAVTDCGQHTVVVSDASPAGEVDLWYVSLLAVPSPTVVTDLSRFRDHIDLFVVAADGGIYSTFWDASSGGAGHWFRV